MPSPSSSRLKREECGSTKHDSVFSNWKILIGPSDWEDYSLGKDGVERYKIHNLPTGCSCPGIYELGLSAIPNNEGYRSYKHTSDKIIVVYLGEAENIRTRLQHYGRAGSHLDNGNKIKTLSYQRGPGLFKEIFSRGYSIMFRWAPMTNKKEAEKMEAQLLGVFDYAWNRRANGTCRREDILLKLDNAVKSPVHAILRKIGWWKHLTFGKKVGIKVSTSWPLDKPESSHDGYRFLLPRVFKFGKSQARLVPGDDICNADYTICGVAIGDGSICTNRPVDGRKRCIKHKGKKISGTSSAPVRKIKATERNSSVCGMVLEDGSCCMELTDHEIKRCELHKGRKINETRHEVPEIRLLELLETTVLKPNALLVQGDINPGRQSNICGFVSSDGSFCKIRSILGSKLCEMHREQSNEGPKLPISTEYSVREGMCYLDDIKICGVITGDGCVCKREPVSGRKRCEEHKGKKINRTSLIVKKEVSADTFGSSICGVSLVDGSVCTNPPVPARKRCELHKGMRVTIRDRSVLKSEKLRIRGSS